MGKNKRQEIGDENYSDAMCQYFAELIWVNDKRRKLL